MPISTKDELSEENLEQLADDLEALDRAAVQAPWNEVNEVRVRGAEPSFLIIASTSPVGYLKRFLNPLHEASTLALVKALRNNVPTIVAALRALAMHRARIDDE